MKLVRPYVPLNVRCAVAARQLLELQHPGLRHLLMAEVIQHTRARDRLQYLLHCLFGDEPVHLDHDPCLALRYYDDETGKYDPPANDPRFLRYCTETEHRTKTLIHGDRGQFSDLALIRREKRRKAKRNGKVRQAVSGRAGRGSVGLGSAGHGKAGKPAGAQSKGVAPALPLQPNRWPPRGSRPLQGRSR